MNITDIGPSRTLDQNTQDRVLSLPRATARIGLLWQAGRRGKPSLNAVIALDENSNAAAHLAANIADRDFEVLGTNMTTALSTYNAEGGITLTTAGAADDQAILLPHLDSGQSSWTQWTWGTDRETEWEVYLQTGSSVTNAIYWAGLKLTNTPVITTDADQAYFRYEDDSASGKLLCVYSAANVDYTFDTGITPVVSTRYLLAIKFDAGRFATFYVNGYPVHRSSVALTTAIDLIPYVGVEADGATAAKSFTVFHQEISRLPGA